MFWRTPNDSTPLGRTVFLSATALILMGSGAVGLVYAWQASDVDGVAQDVAQLRSLSGFSLLLGGALFAVVLYFKPWRMKK